MSCEKNTDRLFLNLWDKIFNHIYKTNNNKNLFDSLIPDGYDIINNNLFIIENKKDIKDKINAKKQLIKYYNNVIIKEEYNFNEIYLIFGYGDNENNFNYEIFIINKENKLVKINKTLENIKENMEIKENFDENEIHKFNQYMWDNGIILNKSQKTLFVASILLSLKVDINFIKDYNINKPGFIIADKMLELIQKGYNDETFTNQFNFLKKSLNNKYLYDLINKIYIDIKKYGKDILNKFYSEFCKYDKNDDSKIGVVLTPHDIIELMIKELDIKKEDFVLDFCTGTGSFLLEASKHSNNLIGCECNEERYALSKCNFILNDLKYDKLYYNSCFNQTFQKVEKSIINPPFSCNCPDEEVEENITNWKNYKNEQRFLLYQIQCLKENGLGACIIPRSNFNNTVKKTNEFKKEMLKHIEILKIINCNNKVFYPISTECTIIIYKRIKSVNEPKASKNVKIIDYSKDGYEIKKKIRIKTKKPEIKEQTKDLNYNDDWNFQYEIQNNLNFEKIYLINYYKNLIQDLQNRIILLENNEVNINDFINNNEKINDDLKKFNFEKQEIKKLKINDYFEIIKPLKIFQIKNSIEGNIPLISSTYFNNGIVKYINDYSYDGECLSIARNGSVGSCFVQKGKIGITTDIILLKSKENNNINIKLWSIIINYYLSKKYNYTNKLSVNKLLNEIFNIPIYNEKDINELLINLSLYINQYKDIDFNFKIKEYKKLKIGDYFDLLPPGKIDGNKNNTLEGNYCLVSTGQQNNGIIKYVNQFEYDGENNNYLTIAMYGSTGSCFYQKCKFIVNHNVRVLTPKQNNNIDLDTWALMINYHLTKKYSYSNGLSINKLLNEEINIPFFEK